jgi:hypothetical protein
LIDIEGDDRAVSIARLEEQDDDEKVGEEIVESIETEPANTDPETSE